MANDYITLANSNSSLVKKFRVFQSGYAPKRSKMGARRVTVTGAIDNQVGPIRRSWEYTIAAYETDPTDPTGSDGATEGYGTLSHLETFFGYDDPGGTPTNVITLTDFDTTTHSVYIVGTMVPKMISGTITGTSAQFAVPITMEKTTAE